MRILFCCQFYAPSVGGVQELVRQIAEQMVIRGHTVTVATTALPNRDFEMLNGVTIAGFTVAGNYVEGLSGEIERYQNYVVNGDFDAMLVYAAQQWTFDALWPVLERIPFPKVMGPCGFSNFYEPAYAKYFSQMPTVLARFEHLVFNATHYRDIDLARQHRLENLTILPNGASRQVFDVPVDSSFRRRHGIPENSFLFLTVGSFTGLKGHAELLSAFELLRLPASQHATLLLNGNVVRQLETGVVALAKKFVRLVRSRGVFYALAQVRDKLLRNTASPHKSAALINSGRADRQVLVMDLPKPELTQAFFAADLFVFASNIEHSPLVLFESAAAGTPFLTVSVGNAAEIAEWTQAGVLCPSTVDAKGYTHAAPQVLADAMRALMTQPAQLDQLGKNGRINWADKFTWEKIAIRYEQLFSSLIQKESKY